MKNLDSIFLLHTLDLGTKFDYIYSLELQWVLAGFKKIAKLEPFTLELLDKAKAILRELDIQYHFIEKDEYFDEERMLFLKWKKEGKTYIDFYISKEIKVLDLLRDILKISDVKKKNLYIWKLLWYPECCIQSFLNFPYEGDVSFNQIIKQQTVWNFDWRLNNLINPYSLVPFFPCSYNCKNAILYAEKNLSIVWKREEIKAIFRNTFDYRGFWDVDIVSFPSQNSSWYFTFQ